MNRSINQQTTSIRNEIQRIVSSIIPLDHEEQEHITFVQKWIASGVQLFRIEKPAIPDTHLVSYFVLLDEEVKKILLVDHKKAKLWLPTGGHVEWDEHPKETVKREIREELAVEAEFLSPDPFFITVTKTVGTTAGHTDVSLWYILKGRISFLYVYDKEEFQAVQWFAPAEIPYRRAEPHMARCIQKLRSINLLD
jgi:8-oxo-dGTP diphosphatase